MIVVPAVAQPLSNSDLTSKLDNMFFLVVVGGFAANNKKEIVHLLFERSISVWELCEQCV